MDVEKKLLKEIETYCKSNNVTDVDKFINELIVTGFNIKKYGAAPAIKKTAKLVEKQSEPEKKPTVKNTKDDDYEDLYDNDKFAE